MRKIEPILLGFLALILVLIVYSLVKPASYTPLQNTTAVEDLNSDLKALDATDLDTGTDAQLDQLSSDSTSF